MLGDGTGALSWGWSSRRARRSCPAEGSHHTRQWQKSEATWIEVDGTGLYLVWAGWACESEGDCKLGRFGPAGVA